MRNMKWTTAVLLVLVLGTGIFLATRPGKTITSEKREFKVGTWKTAQTIQPFFYSEHIPEGDSVEVLPFTNPGDQKTALLAGNLDMCGTTWVTAISAASNGEPVRVVAAMTRKCSALTVASEGGINSVSDLRGKMIAYVPGTMHHILLLEALAKAGLDPLSDVTLIQIDFFDMGQALAGGQIDAFCSGEPYPSIAVVQGYGKILEYPYYDDSIGFINAGMMTTEKKILEDPEGISKLVKAHVKATEFLTKNEEVWLRASAEFGTDPAVLKEATENMELAWEITPETIRQVKNLAQRMLDLGTIKTIPDIDMLIDLSFLQSISD